MRRGVRLGSTGEYSREYYSARLEAWLEARLGAAYGTALEAAQLGSNMARVDSSRLLPRGALAARGLQWQNVQAARVGYLLIR